MIPDPPVLDELDFAKPGQGLRKNTLDPRS